VPSQYNPRSILRQIPNTLLDRFFAQFPEFSDLDWSALKETQIEPVFERWQAMPDPVRHQIGMVFRKVHSLADSVGTTVLIESARDRGLEIAEEISTKQNGYGRALWCFLEHPEIFDNARTLAHIDALPRQSWEKRNGLPKKAIQVSEATLVKLGEEISSFYQKREGRGHQCKVEYRRREGSIDSFFAYPADYADELTGYDDDGGFSRKSWHPAFEVVFSCNNSAGTLELFARGGKKIRDELSVKFSRAVFGEDYHLQPWQSASFHLDVFKNPNISFPTDPADNITWVGVRALRLRIHGRPSGRLTLEIEGRNQNASVFDLVAATLDQRRTRLEDTTVLNVTMQALFRTPGSKDRSITFKLSAGSYCDLGETPEELLLRKYLRLWGIDRDA